MRTAAVVRAKKPPRSQSEHGQPSVGIRELKAKASAIVADVKGRRVAYAVTKHGTVEALIVPVDAGERLLGQPGADSAWDALESLVERLSKETGKKIRSATEELQRMRR